jgi:lysozyme
MRYSERAVKAAKFFESGDNPDLEAYLCPAGRPTIGFGHTLRVKLGDVCTRDQAEAWLAMDLQESANVVNELVKVQLVQYEFDALVLFCMNIDPGDFTESETLQILNAGNKGEFAAMMIRWCHINKHKFNEGLFMRRIIESMIFLNREFEPAQLEIMQRDFNAFQKKIIGS